METKNETLEDLIVIPGREMRELCKRTISACNVPVYTKSQIKENETDEYYFVSITKYKFLLKALENFLAEGVKI